MTFKDRLVHLTQSPKSADKIKKPRTTVKKTIQPKESDICIAFIEYCKLKHPSLLVIKIDNEGKTSWALGKQKKKEGKIAGAADYFVARRSTRAIGLWLEMKTNTGKVSQKQKEFGTKVTDEGYAYVVTHGLDGAILVLEEYLKS